MLQAAVFGTVNGLPVHVLVVHAVVVGVPALALLTVVVAARAPWRARWGWAVVGLDVLLLGLVWFTVQAGRALQARFDGTYAAQHAEYGARMPWFTLALALAAAVSALAGPRRRLGALAFVLALVAATAAVYAVVLTGESGSRSIWEGRLPAGR